MILLTAFTMAGCAGGQAESEATNQVAQPAETAAGEDTQPTFDAEHPLRIGTMRGPSSMGLVYLMDDPRYSFDVVGSPDQLTARLATGDLDAAVLPVNVAATLYNRVPDDVRIVAVTAQGALYAVTANPDVADGSVADLAGKTILSTGHGGTPQTVLEALLAGAGVTAQVQYLAEAPEVVAQLALHPDAVAILPEPFVTSALAQDPNLRVVLDLNEAWREQTGTDLATVVLVVSRQIAADRPAEVSGLVADVAYSTTWVNEHPGEAAPKIVELEIVPNATIAQAAIPRVHLVTWTGPDARDAVLATLAAMYEANPESIGGAVPDDRIFWE